MLTSELLHSLFTYNPETGLFTRNNKKRNRDRARKHTGYINIFVLGKSYKAHRLAWLYMTGEFPSEFIDHINKIKTDNRWANLRLATSQQNNQNSPLRKDNTSGHRGVYFCKKYNRWRAKACHGKKFISLGMYSKKEDAIAAYVRFASKTHKEFYTDFIQAKV